MCCRADRSRRPQEVRQSRLSATGLVGTRLFVLMFTLRQSAVHIISLRKANQREVPRYVSSA